MAMARQNIQPQNHFFGRASFCTLKKYKMIIAKTAIINDAIKKLGSFRLVNVAAKAYGNKITEPTKQVAPMFLIKSHFLSTNKKYAATICKPHFAPAMPVDNNFCGKPLYKGHTSTNHQVITVDKMKYNIAR